MRILELIVILSGSLRRWGQGETPVSVKLSNILKEITKPSVQKNFASGLLKLLNNLLPVLRKVMIFHNLQVVQKAGDILKNIIERRSRSKMWLGQYI